MELLQGEFAILIEVKCKPNQSCPDLRLCLHKAHLEVGYSQKNLQAVPKLQISQSYTHHPICVQVRKFHQSHQFRV